jgi:outer membrane protein
MMTAALLAAAAGPAAAQQASSQQPSYKIGFVNTERVMSESRASIEVQKNLEAEFQRRTKEIDAGPPGEADRRRRALADDMNLKRDEALKQIVDRSTATIKRVAEQENLDAVFLEAVYAAPQIDITDKVIKALDAAR